MEKKKGTLLWRISSKFQFAADRFIPTPLVFCLVLTIIAFGSAMIFTESHILDLLQYWFDGFWTQCTFAFQISLYVVTCSVTAKAPQVRKLIQKLAGIPRTRTGALLILMAFGYAVSFLNWAACLVATPILAQELSKKIKGLHFPMMIAAGYSTMMLGQALCPTNSVYGVVVAQGHFLEQTIGVLEPTGLIFNSVNIGLFLILAAVTVIVTIRTLPGEDEVVEFTQAQEEEISMETAGETDNSAAEKMNNSKVLMYVLGIAGVVVCAKMIIEKGFLASFTLNAVIFAFMIINCFLYNTPIKFMNAYKENMGLIVDIMIQFPFYGGLGGVMTSSGLGAVMVEGILTVATARTLPLWSYISASAVNLFIPSQGGQFIVQGPIITDAAVKLGANVNYVLNAFVMGDEGTNMLQPLYMMLPLSVVNIKLKKVWGFMAFIWVFWFVITMFGWYFLPMILA